MFAFFYKNSQVNGIAQDISSFNVTYFTSFYIDVDFISYLLSFNNLQNKRLINVLAIEQRTTGYSHTFTLRQKNCSVEHKIYICKTYETIEIRVFSLLSLWLFCSLCAAYAG